MRHPKPRWEKEWCRASDCCGKLEDPQYRRYNNNSDNDYKQTMVKKNESRENYENKKTFSHTYNIKVLASGKSITRTTSVESVPMPKFNCHRET